MTNILLAALLMLFAVLTVFLVLTLIELRKTSRELSEFLKNTDSSLRPVLEDLDANLKNIKNITGDISAVTEDAKAFSSSVREVADGVKSLADMLGGIEGKAKISVQSIRAGAKAAIEVLARNFLTKGGNR
jgi:uncharacterized protein YoxC